MITIYGIKNCDTMKKAFNWLECHGIDYTFHDYKKLGLDEKTLNRWLKTSSWEDLLNRRGTTFRKLPQEIRDSINIESAKIIMLENLSAIKRPILDIDGKIILGFAEADYKAAFK